MMADREHETLWVLRAQVGGRDALEALFKAVQAPLFRYIVGLVDDGALAEDILQEVLFRIYRKLGWLREPALFRPWCYRIATREVYRRLKREKRWSASLHDPGLLDAVEAPPPGEAEIDQGLLARLPALLRAVSPGSRAVLVLHYQNQLTLDEVAVALGVPVGTVKSRLAYGLAALRRVLVNEDQP